MGGASKVLTASTLDGVVEKAREWFEGAVEVGLFPREFVYGSNHKVEIEFNGEKIECFFAVSDLEEKPEDAETETPFGSLFYGEEDKKLRYHAFVSAHT